MKVIIAGNRNCTRQDLILAGFIRFKDLHGTITEVIDGDCPGIDRLGRELAKKHHKDITIMPVKWKLPNGSTDYSAGPRRNARMIAYANGLVAIWDGKSKGTGGCIKLAEQKGIPVVVVHWDG
jgi:hypothetical protein